MQVSTSYKIKILDFNNIFNDTLEVYRSALGYIIDVVYSEWGRVSAFSGLKLQQRFVETLIHGTSKNTACYDFDKMFYKLPSYLRRSAISEAIGKVKSYISNLERWETLGRNGKAPKLQKLHNAYPALFRDNMYIRKDDYTACIKIYHKNDWVWLTVRLRKSDVDYINKYKAHLPESAPTLERKGKNWYLRFAFVETVTLTDKKEVITSVDLGITNAATCSAMLPDGTVIGRKVIRFPVEQDRMGHKLNKIKKAQQNGARGTPRLWSYVNNYNRSISEKTAKEIIEFAVLHGSNVIVFEHLDTHGKKRGSKKQKLHLWRKQSVIAMVTVKAHLRGMRISTVCARNTSRLAFDGSGQVLRDKDNYSMCTFATGKRYHSDLNAAYNIGARYYIRENLKSLPETVRFEVEAKVPRLSRRTTCTLSDLISLDAELRRLTA